jgi:hypothetical protein
VKRLLLILTVGGCGLTPLNVGDSGDNAGDAPGETDRWRDADADTDVDTDADADADTDTDTDTDGSITYPTEAMKRVLLYYGHGGPDGTDLNNWGQFETVIPSYWAERYGWEVDWTNQLPDIADITDYRMIGLIGPGLLVSFAFDDDDTDVLKRALAHGTRIVLFTDRSACGDENTRALMGALGVSMRPTGEGELEREVVLDANVGGGHQITAGVTSLKMVGPCWVDEKEGTVLVRREVDGQTHVYAAVERPGNGGDVVIVGDFEIFDDSNNLANENNQQFVDNLAQVTP